MFNKNYIILSSVDWRTHSQIHHAITKHLISSGKKILFVENTGTRTLKFRDIDRVKERLKSILKSKNGFVNLNKNLTIFTPLFIPFHFNFIFKILNNLLVVRQILKWVKQKNFKDPVVINFIPNPITETIIKNMGFVANFYFIADNMTLNYPKKNLIENCEKNIIKNSDYIFYTSDLLKKKFISLNKKNVKLSSGVDFLKFNIKKKLNKKFIIGYIGAIREIIDENIIEQIAKKIPDSEIWLVGPELINLQILKKYKNVKFFGKVAHNSIPKILSNFNVGIIPYKKNLFTDSIYPLKLNEYLAASLPVVSTNIETINNFNKNYPDIIKISNNTDQFITLLKKYKTKKILINKKKLKFIAKENSWENKFKILDDSIDHILFEKNFKKVSLKKKIKNFFNKNIILYFDKVFLVLIITIIYLI